MLPYLCLSVGESLYVVHPLGIGFDRTRSPTTDFQFLMSGRLFRLPEFFRGPRLIRLLNESVQDVFAVLIKCFRYPISNHLKLLTPGREGPPGTPDRRSGGPSSVWMIEGPHGRHTCGDVGTLTPDRGI